MAVPDTYSNCHAVQMGSQMGSSIGWKGKGAFKAGNLWQKSKRLLNELTKTWNQGQIHCSDPWHPWWEIISLPSFYLSASTRIRKKLQLLEECPSYPSKRLYKIAVKVFHNREENLKLKHSKEIKQNTKCWQQPYSRIYCRVTQIGEWHSPHSGLAHLRPQSKDLLRPTTTDSCSPEGRKRWQFLPSPNHKTQAWWVFWDGQLLTTNWACGGTAPTTTFSQSRETLSVTGKVISFLSDTRGNCSVLPEFSWSVGVKVIPTIPKWLCNLLGHPLPCYQLSNHSPGTWQSNFLPTTLPSDLTGSQDAFIALHSPLILWPGILPTTLLLPFNPPCWLNYRSPLFLFVLLYAKSNTLFSWLASRNLNL